MWKAILMSLGLVVAVGFAVGCGSGDDDATSASLTRAQYLEQAGAICNKTRGEIQEAAAAQAKNGKQVNYDSAASEILGPALKREAEELQELPAPSADEATLAHMLESLSKAAAAFSKEGAGSESSASIKKFTQETEAYGLEDCVV